MWMISRETVAHKHVPYRLTRQSPGVRENVDDLKRNSDLPQEFVEFAFFFCWTNMSHTCCSIYTPPFRVLNRGLYPEMFSCV